MDNFIENVSGYSMWDIRNAIDKVTAKVMNYTEMEQKVREATSNDPWGASGTLKQELAQATHNFQHFNEIMPAIFKRFAEKESREWRHIYKSLVLLEYLVTHGSERVVDEARGHISTIKYLRSFQFVDDNGKDEGINVRNRAKEFAEMLSSVDRIKEERKKAKANRNKFIGSEGGGGMSGGSGGFAGTGSKYGGFGSDSYFDSSYSGSSSGSGYPGSGSSSRGGSRRAGRYDDEDAGSSPPPRRSKRAEPAVAKSAPKPEPVKEVNLFDFDEPVSAPANQFKPQQQQQQQSADDWGTLQSATDDFDDFQSAPPVKQSAPAFPAFNPSMASVMAPALPHSNNNSNNTSNFSGFGAPTKPASGGNSGGFDLLGSSPVKSNITMGSFAGSIPPIAGSSSSFSNPAPSSSSSTFSAQTTNPQPKNSNDIWANASGLISLDGLGKTKAKEAAPSMNALAANSWNSGAWATNTNNNNNMSKPLTPMGGNGQTGFGSFDGNMATGNTNNNSNNNNANKNSNNFGDLLF
ncbi:Epsin-3, clathrin recruitment and traffic between the Golgi and endosome [Podila humilis]|nr:Epsin-3, clathrin recruitment and traffic between the Golgi and endosome [Podila humilis]